MKKSKDIKSITYQLFVAPRAQDQSNFDLVYISFRNNNMTSLIQKIISVFLRPTSNELETEEVMFEKNEDSMPLVNKIGSAKTDTTFDKLPRRAQMLLGLQKNWKFQKGYKSRFLGSKARKPLKVA